MNDWIEWNGGECPVETGTLVDVKYRNGNVNFHVMAGVCECCSGSDPSSSASNWGHLDFHSDIVAYRVHNQAAATSEQPSPKPNKYSKQVNGASIDVYDVLMAWNVTNPAVQHAIKKLLQPGNRGHKDKLTDLSEARDSIIRAIELESK